MKCPFCEKELVNGEQKCFETVADHVSNPNAENYPLRSTWICNCEKASGSFWDDDGSFYIGYNLPKEKRAELIKTEKKSPIGSFYESIGY